MEGTKYLGCPVHTEAGKWENRLIFIKEIINDFISTTSKGETVKGETVALISTGSGLLLPEFLIGKALIEEGYDLSFFLIDPMYFDDKREKKMIKELLKEFETSLNTVYQKEFPKEKIVYLERPQD